MTQLTSPMGPRRAPGEDVAASRTGFSMDGTNFGACFWFGKRPRTPDAVGPEGGDPPLATAKFWSVTARYSTERFLLGVGSHTYPPCKKGVSACMVFGVPFSCGYLTLEVYL